MTKITPIILSGGSGTRLWPMSTPERPKQFLALTSDKTMFQMTLDRTKPGDQFGNPIIIANARHREIIEKQLAEAGADNATLLLEPCGRNTAPAIALAALACEDKSSPILVMPSDHVIADISAFHRAIESALPHLDEGWLVTFGIEATAPETGYGYIKLGGELSPSVHRVERFLEKPESAEAEAMLAEGGYAWNGGIFLFRADHYLGALSVHAPDMLAAAHKAMDQAERDGNAVLPDKNSFEACPADSVDYAVMEKSDRVAVVPVSMGWSDVGSWDALAEIAGADESATAIESNGNFVRSDGKRIHLAGLENMIVIASDDDIMIVPRGQSQLVKQIAEAQEKKG